MLSASLQQSISYCVHTKLNVNVDMFLIVVHHIANSYWNEQKKNEFYAYIVKMTFLI